MPGTSGLAHVSPVQADATVATAHSRGQPQPQGGTAPHSAPGVIQGLAQPSAIAANERHSGRLRNSSLFKDYSTDVTTYAPLPFFLKSARKPRISTHGERRHGLPSLKSQFVSLQLNKFNQLHGEWGRSESTHRTWR